jgi:hypothetical protein
LTFPFILGPMNFFIHAQYNRFITSIIPVFTLAEFGI